MRKAILIDRVNDGNFAPKRMRTLQGSSISQPCYTSGSARGIRVQLTMSLDTRLPGDICNRIDPLYGTSEYFALDLFPDIPPLSRYLYPDT